MDILDIFGHFYLNHLSRLWGYFSFLWLHLSCHLGFNQSQSIDMAHVQMAAPRTNTCMGP